MSYTIYKTEDYYDGRKIFYVYTDADEQNSIWIKASATATQSDIDAQVDQILQNEKDLATLLKEQEEAAAYAAEHGDG
tara:strand:+ start:3784 stop:4017 length:234 start_codon:yes stop_codon:yes gene_type:complete